MWLKWHWLGLMWLFRIYLDLKGRKPGQRAFFFGGTFNYNRCSSFSSQHPDLPEISILRSWITPTLLSDKRYSQTQPWWGNTWTKRCVGMGGLLKKKRLIRPWHVLWPTRWMGSLLSSLEDECCTQAVSLTLHQGRHGKQPCQLAICSQWYANSSSVTCM